MGALSNDVTLVEVVPGADLAWSKYFCDTMYKVVYEIGVFVCERGERVNT